MVIYNHFPFKGVSSFSVLPSLSLSHLAVYFLPTNSDKYTTLPPKQCFVRIRRIFQFCRPRHVVRLNVVAATV